MPLVPAKTFSANSTAGLRPQPGDGVVYIGTNQGEVKALEDGGSSDARVKWTFCVKPSGDGSKCDEDLHGVYDSPAVGEKLVYVAGTDGYLYAIEKDSGTIGQSGWRRAVGRGQEPYPVVGGPTLVADRNLVLWVPRTGDCTPSIPDPGTQ